MRSVVAMRNVVVVVMLLIGACADDAPIAEPDAGMMEPSIDATRPDPGAPDYYGESCTEAAYPAVTVCRSDDSGWCVAGRCRPQCDDTRSACAAGHRHFTDRGACYCSP